MNSQDIEILKGTETIGGNSPKHPNQKFEIQTKDFTDVQQGVPLKLFYGNAKIAGLQITPIFGFRSEQITTKVGK